MTLVEGIVVAVISAAVTLVTVSAGGLALAWMHVHEERRGSGCRGAGCRRSRSGQGWVDAWGGEGTSLHDFHTRRD